MKTLDELLIEMQEEGINDDTAHETLMHYARECLTIMSAGMTLTPEEETRALEAYIQGFCNAEGYKNG